MSIEALLVLVLVIVPIAACGVPATLAAWPVAFGAAAASLVVGTGVAKMVARRVVAGENKEAAAYLEQARVEIVQERADLDARARALDYGEQLHRRIAAANIQERRELAEQRQRQERQGGELTGARQHIQRLKRKTPVEPE